MQHPFGTKKSVIGLAVNPSVPGRAHAFFFSFRLRFSQWRPVARPYPLPPCCAQVPLARYMASRSLRQLKRYQIGKVYRRENTQKGRLREFIQAVCPTYPLPPSPHLCG